MNGQRQVGLPRRLQLRRAGVSLDADRATPRARGLALRVPAWLPALLIFCAGLLPRVAGLNDFYTTDEAYYWQGRVARFAAAVSQGDWAATNQTGHPGVTTMWLGSLGQWLAIRTGVAPPGPGGGAEFLAALRLPLAVANALAVAAGYLLLRLLMRPGPALLAGLCWAASPFLIAHGRLLHLDALLTSWTTLSLLCLLVASAPGERGDRARLLALLGSGLLAGLAMLTKAPGLILLPVTACCLLVTELRERGLRWRTLGAAAARTAGRFGLWLLAAVLVAAALWPALWVDPAGALGVVAAEIAGNGAQPHSAGNFFMGQPVADPGWRFYLSVIVWRGEIPVLAGLASLGLLALRGLVRRHDGPLSWPTDHAGERWTVAVLGGFAVLFTLGLTLLAKKFDRYLLPLWPSLAILGAVGLWGLRDSFLASAHGLTHVGRRAVAATACLLLIGSLAAPPAIYRPYYLAYFNPLLGGGTTAQAVLLTGWGEGMEQAGAWLEARPDLRRGPILSWLPATLTPFVPPDVAVYDLDTEQLVEPANYAVVYNSVAERDTRAVAEAYALQTPPLYTLRVHGISYITIHQLPRPFKLSVGAVFGELHLRGYSRELSTSRLVITPSWDVQADRAGGVFTFVHVLDERGQRVAQIDALLDDGMFATWQEGQQFGTPLPLALPELAPGRYRVVLGLYTQPDGIRVPLTFAPDGYRAGADAGPESVELFSFVLGPERRPLVAE